MPEFAYQDPFPLAPDSTQYRHLGSDPLGLHGTIRGRGDPQGQAGGADAPGPRGASRRLVPVPGAHLAKVAAILDDPEASANDRGVALALLKNAAWPSGFKLPMCQDTGTATIIGKKGQRVWTGVQGRRMAVAGDLRDVSEGKPPLLADDPAVDVRGDQLGDEPAGPDRHLCDAGAKYEFLFVAKGGGSANKSMLFQETKALLNPASLENSSSEKLRSLGTAACPPYHLAVVIGGTSAEATMKTVKLASTGYLDTLPTEGNTLGQAFRDPELEAKVMELARKSGIGAQFGGKYFALDARVIRLPRHGATCPVGIGVSCSADRNIKARIDRDGIWLEELERDPARFIPAQYRAGLGAEHGVKVDLNRPMPEILAELSKYPISTPLKLTGTIVVARDIAHAKIKERLDRGEGMPDYLKNHPVYYAGPAKTPEGMPSGSFGPTTAGRMDSYVDLFQSQGGSMVMIAKGNRSQAGHRRLQEARRLLPRLDRRPGRDPGPGEHQEGRAARVPRAGHGSRLQDRRRRLPGVHPGR